MVQEELEEVQNDEWREECVEVNIKGVTPLHVLILARGFN